MGREPTRNVPSRMRDSKSCRVGSMSSQPAGGGALRFVLIFGIVDFWQRVGFVIRTASTTLNLLIWKLPANVEASKVL